jgi:PPOX class probable F420-dependent enzyme
VWLQTLPEWARELLASVRVARLGLLDEDDRPRVLAVTFAIFDGAVWSAIDHKPKRTAPPARLRRLRRRPEAALLVDRYDNDWSRLAWVELLGRVAILEAEEAPGALDALAARYKPYRLRRPPGPLLRFEVEAASSWRARDLA